MSERGERGERGEERERINGHVSICSNIYTKLCLF